MKKTILALCISAITGITMMSCSDEDSNSGQPAPNNTPSNTQTDCNQDASICSGDKPYCVKVPNGNYVCSAKQNCDQDSSRNNDGDCIGPDLTNEYCASLGLRLIITNEGIHACVIADPCNAQCNTNKPYCVQVPDGSYVCSAAQTCTGKQERQADGTCVVPPDNCNDQCTGETPYCVQIPSGSYLCSAIESCTAPQTRKNDGTCAVPDNCNNQCTDEKPYCVHVPNGNYVCAMREECTDGLIRDNDGYCLSPIMPQSCMIHETCENGYLCGVDNKCVPEAEAGNVYRYVRIEDLSNVTSASAEPGADIDAVVLYKPSTGEAYVADNISAFHPVTENFTERIESNPNVAGDPTRILGKPDAFNYTNGLANNKCVYKDTEGRYTFVSLGGNGGYIVVEMSGAIRNGDRLDILELGGCELENAGDDTGTIAAKEKIKVSISADSNSWIVDNTFVRPVLDEYDKGQLSWTISGLAE